MASTYATTNAEGYELHMAGGARHLLSLSSILLILVQQAGFSTWDAEQAV